MGTGLAGTLILAACVVAVAGYRPDGGSGYAGYCVGGYAESFGYDYGGWGHGYHEAPPRGGDRGHDRAQPAYRRAPPGRHSTSIPARPRRR